jgi:hypothetical protein
MAQEGLFLLDVTMPHWRLLVLRRQDADGVRLSSPAVRSLAVAHAVGERRLFVRSRRPECLRMIAIQRFR